MFKNIRRAALSLVWVALAFGVYLLCVVPFVERPTRKESDEPEYVQQPSLGNSTDRFVSELVDLGFPEGSWELDQPKVLQSPQATILLKDFSQLDDRSLKLQPCTLIFYGSDRDRSSGKRGPTIMQAPEGAELNFDQPINIDEFKLGGKLVGGRLVGGIRIFSAGGPDSDDLEMRTSNVQITSDRVWTPEKVTFQFGNSYGAGEYLVLTRSTSEQTPVKGKPKKQASGSIDLLQELGEISLDRIERLSVELPNDDMFDALGSTGKKSARTPPGTAATVPTRVDLLCDGPLRFDLQRMIATLEKNVSITRQLPSKPADTLNASQLAIHLTRKAKDGRIDGQPMKKPHKLSINRVVAVGDPMVINVRSQHAYVETKRLEYNFETKRIKLRGYNEFAPAANQSGQVLLRNLDHQITSPAIDVRVTKNRAETQLVAEGPGQYVGSADLSNEPTTAQTSNFSATTSTTEKNKIAASWTQRLSLQPYNNQQILKIEGKATVRSPGFGSVQSDNIDLWLTQTKPIATRLDGTPITKTIPVRLTTYSSSGRKTTISSPQFNGTLSKATVVFASGIPPTDSIQESNAFQIGGQRRQDESNAPLKSSYRINGGEVTAWVDVDNRKLQRIVVHGETRINEESNDPNVQPFELAGSDIDFQLDSFGRPTARLVGTPATLRTSELHLTGNDIQLQGPNNRIIIPGAGTVRAKYDPSALSDGLSQTFANNQAVQPNRSLASPVPKPGQLEEIEVQWKNGFVFDGQVATLEGEVIATGRDVAVRTADLVVTLDQRVDLSKLDESKITPKIAHLTAKSGVTAGGRRRNEQGKPESYQQIVTQDLDVNFGTGEIVANGPGWISVTTTADKLSTNLSGSKPTNAPAKNELRQLSLAFSRQLTGNLHRREAFLDDNIQGWLGPVAKWEDRVDPLEKKQLGEDDLRLSCRLLHLLESPTAIQPSGAGRKPIELLASGGAHVESQLYFARGNRIKFVEEKGVLTLEGDQNRLAEFWQRNSATEKGAMSGKARLIQYMRNSGELRVLGGTGVEMDLSSLPKRQK